MTDVVEIKGAIETARTELMNALDKQQSELKSVGKTTAETADRITTAEKRLDEELKAMGDRLSKFEAKQNRPDTLTGAIRKSIGQMYVESDVFAEVKRNQRGNGVPVEVKAITDGAGSAGALTDAMRVQTIFKNPDRQIFIRDLVNNMPTQDSAVEVMRELAFTNNAAPQAGQLVAKAESDITFSLETYKVQTVAHWLAASRQILSDAPRLRAFIDGRLMYGLDLEFDSQLLYGDGTGQNFTGLMVDADVSDIGASAAGDGAVWLEHIRKAITQCQLFEYYNINGVVLNPQDWQEIELAKGSDGHYIWVSVPQGGESRLWRVPVVVSNAMTQGDFILGDWTMGATLYLREQKSVRVSESHADFFVKNGVAVLAEERAAFAIELPKAFCKGTFTPAA